MMRVLTIAGALLVIAQLHRAGGGVISSELHRSFGLGGTEIGVVIGSMMLASAVAQVPMGLAFDRFGIRRTAAALALVALAGTLVFGSAKGGAGLAIGRFLIGIGFGGAITVIMLLAMRWAPRERFATVAATAIASASLLGGLLGTAPLAVALERLGWTATFVAIALLTALAAMLVLLVVRDAPASERMRAHTAESLVESLRGLLAILADPRLRPLLIMGVCTIAPFACVGGLWAGPYLQDVHGLDREQASFVLLGLVAAYNLGTLGYGRLDRRFGAHRGVVIAGAGLSALCLAVLALRAPAAVLGGRARAAPRHGRDAVLRHADVADARSGAAAADRSGDHQHLPVRPVRRVSRAMADRHPGRLDGRSRPHRLRIRLSPGVRLRRPDPARGASSLRPRARAPVPRTLRACPKRPETSSPP